MIAAGVITGLAATGLSALLGASPAAAAPCANPLAQVVHAAGWRGHDARVAWAIAMRESKGQPRVISSTGDWGIFQINKATWGSQPWWSDTAMLTAHGNAKAAYRISEGGKTFRAWGLDGKGQPHPDSPYPTSVHVAYLHWHVAYPKACR